MTSTIDALKNTIDGRPAVDPDQLLQEAAVKKEELRAKLQRGSWIVEFTKVDGTPSIMECTLDTRFLPPGEEKQDAGTKAADNPTVLRVFAVDRDGWRSFKVLNVTKFYATPESI